jgi:hypothetical protein
MKRARRSRGLSIYSLFPSDYTTWRLLLYLL